MRRREVMLLWMLACGAAAGQELAQLPQLHVGDRWRFVRRIQGQGDALAFSHEVKRIDGDEALILGEGPQGRFWSTYQLSRAHWVRQYTFDATASDQKGAVTYDGSQDEPLLSFPLAVGKQWPHRRSWKNAQGSTGADEGIAKVVALEKVTTPAGEFDAFRIEVRGKFTNYQSRVRDRFAATQWYAPSAKRIVRAEYKSWFQGRLATHYVDELTDMQLRAP